MIPSWLYISDLSGTSGTTVITVSAGTNDNNTVRLSRLVPTNTQGDSNRLDIAQIASGDTIPIDYSQYLTFIINSSGNIYWKASSTARTYTIEYSKDNGSTWTSITSSTAGTSFNVSAGDKIILRGNNVQYAINTGTYNYFTTTVSFEIEGNIMSLIDCDNFSEIRTIESGFTFMMLFYNCTGLTSITKLLLPATTLAPYCYYYMFRNCSSLISTLKLPATNLSGANYCYGAMFEGCTGLISTPILPATTLGNYCYASMFKNCTSLTTAPELPAISLTYSCYSAMFGGCTGLTTAPELPAPTLVDGCYSNMFNGCTSLITAPDLLATTLVYGCYTNMFYGCKNLNYIKCLASNLGTSSVPTKQNWVYGVASSGTFVKKSGVNWETGTSGIPNNWTVINQ